MEESCQHTCRSKPSSINSNSSQRSKYLTNTKLTKSLLFSAIKNKKDNKECQERGLELELLTDTLKLEEREEHKVQQMLRNGLKSWHQDCRKLLRALEHYNP